MDETPINFFSTLRTGITDSTNVGGLTEVLLFAVFLYLVASLAPKRLTWLGSGFIFGSALTTPLINLSFFDNIIFSREFDVFLQVAHFILEAASVIVGLICLRDWWIYTRFHDARKSIIKYPFLERPPEGRSRPLFVRLFLFIVAYFCGVGAAFLASAWPGDQRYFSILLYRIFLPGIQWPTFFWSLLYGLAFNFLLILELAGFRKALSSSRIRGSLHQSLTKIQIVAAAVFLAYGGVMIYIYYIRFHYINLV